MSGTKRMQTFEQLIAAYHEQSIDEERRAIEARLWQSYGRRCAVFISDLSGFSRLTHRHSIVHFLGLIHQCRKLLRPVIACYAGTLVKATADNVYAIFEEVPQAIDASIEMQRVLARYNADCPADRQIGLCIGVGYGEILVIDREDFYGHQLNLAFKLGEDVAQPGEVLVTAEAMEQLVNDDYPHELRTAHCSGVTIPHAALRY